MQPLWHDTETVIVSIKYSDSTFAFGAFVPRIQFADRCHFAEEIKKEKENIIIKKTPDLPFSPPRCIVAPSSATINTHAWGKENLGIIII